MSGSWGVIDSNMIQLPELEAFLADGHHAVVPIEIWFELYKQRSVDALRRGLEILARYPRQVLVLRPNGEIIRLDPCLPDLVGAMILPDAGLSIGQMVTALAPEQGLDAEFLAYLTAEWDAAAERNLGMLEGARDIVLSLPEMQEQMFTAAQVGIIRRGERFTHDMFGTIFGAAEQLWEIFSEEMGLPWQEQGPIKADTLNFRIALGLIVYLLWWIARGSQGKKKMEATRNDMLDLFLAAQATYFDGFLTRDDKALWIHDNLRMALHAYENVRLA